MNISREEALKAIDDIFNYCEEIDNSLPENERSGYKMLPDIHKIRKYIIENTRPHGEWEYNQYDGNPNIGNWHCSECRHIVIGGYSQKPHLNFCPNCGASLVKKEGETE